MKSQTLSITAVEYKPFGQEVMRVIKASNPFMLQIKLDKFLKNHIVKAWALVNNDWVAGNTGLNAEAYLYETIEDLNK